MSSEDRKKPVWAVLAGDDLTLVLAHAAAVRNIPGRKSDVKDARWLADLLAHGLVRPSLAAVYEEMGLPLPAEPPPAERRVAARNQRTVTIARSRASTA